MKLAKIKNKYMYETRPDDNGSHYYLIFYNHKEKRYEAAQLTHLYIKDNKRFKQVKKGNILVEKFKEFDVPSGVRNTIYKTNVHKTNINMDDMNNVSPVSNRYLSKKQSNRIFTFLKSKKKS